MKLLRAARVFSSARLLAKIFGVYAAVGFAGAAAAQDQLKVAVVDMAKVFSGYYKTTEINRQIDDARNVAKKELEDRMLVHHRLLEEIARIEKGIDDPALSATAKAERQQQREAKVQEINTLEQDIQDFKATHDRSLREQNNRARNQLVEDIMVIVNARVERDHYDLVLNKSAQGYGGKTIVLHANDSLEITDDVISALNKNRPVVAATPAASPGR